MKTCSSVLLLEIGDQKWENMTVKNKIKCKSLIKSKEEIIQSIVQLFVDKMPVRGAARQSAMFHQKFLHFGGIRAKVHNIGLDLLLAPGMPQGKEQRKPEWICIKI
jgi:hypothetical protein